MALSGKTGEVAAVFRRSFYVRIDGLWACCGGADLGCGPLNVLMDVPPNIDWRAAVGAGGDVEVCGGCLHLPHGQQIRIDTAQLWVPPQPSAWSPESARAGLRMLERLLGHTEIPVGGLGCFARKTARPETDVARFAQAPIEEFSSWLKNRPAEQPDVAHLLGLGPGLTPAGDDFIAAALVTLHAIGRNNERAALFRSVAPALDIATTAISAAHLRGAADGEMSATQHEILSALLSAEDAPLAMALRDLPLDHTSNWDGLAGIARTLRALFD